MVYPGVPDTAEFILAEGVSPTGNTPGISGHIQVNVGGLSHQGKVRTNNEDHFLVIRFGRSLQTLLTNLPECCIPAPHEEIGYGMVVADGLGGRVAGEIASSMAIRELVDLVLASPDWILQFHDPDQAEKFQQRMDQRFHQVNDWLVQQSQENPSLLGMGTTLTTACSMGLDLVLCHIGDSRVYLFRHGELRQLTRDMTLAQNLVDGGMLKPDEAATHSSRHTLTDCLGRGNLLRTELHHVLLESGDRILLCTDGLSGMATDAEIGQVLASIGNPQEACEALVNLALEKGGRDNVTVVVAHYEVNKKDEETNEKIK